MNLKRGAFGHQHGHAAHLAQFQSDLDVGGEESVFDSARVRVVSLDDLFERAGNA